MKRICLLILIILFQTGVKGQTQKDSSKRILMTGLHFSIQQPQYQLAERFGNNLNVGLPVFYKTKTNFIFGLEGNYFFGNTVKEDVLSSFRNQEGTIINNTGVPATIRIFERGFTFFSSAGKIFPTSKRNKNSGVIGLLGIGYMQHKIKFYNPARDVAQLAGTKYKGYDRLSGGVAFSGFIGYFYLSKNKLANFYIGLESLIGITNGLRGYQYDTMKEDNKRRTDGLTGLRVGWILPLYKRTPQEFYYN